MILFRILILNFALYVFPAQAKLIPNIYLKVATDNNIPADILYAIALTESGYRYRSIYNPWPWTLNIEGKAYRFDSYQLALNQLRDAIKNYQSVDAGVMQVNWYWHNEKFNDIKSILDPHINLQVGARILLEQYILSNNWWLAVGRYHAPGKDNKSLKRAERYRQRVRKNWLIIKPILNEDITSFNIKERDK